MIVHARPFLISRGARRVGRLRLQARGFAPDGSVRTRLQGSVEEALQRTTLPQEDQGRVYFFRRLHLPPVGPARDWERWIRRCCDCFVAAARAAVHGAARGAEAAPAVFFCDAHEPFRLVIARLLDGGNPAAAAWFWTPATGVARDEDEGAGVRRVLDGWRFQPGGWAAVARELLPVLAAPARAARIERLLALVGIAGAAAWVAELGRPSAEPAAHAPSLRAHAHAVVRRAVELAGPRDPRVVWLAMLAVAEAAPALAGDARLAELAAGARAEPSTVAAERANPGPARSPLPAPLPAVNRAPALDDADAVEEQSATTLERTRFEVPRPRSASAAAPLAQVDQPTSFGGLYFLLAPLRYLRLAEALAAEPALAAAELPVRILRRLAAATGVPAGDPILAPLLDDPDDREHDRDRRRAGDDPLLLPPGLEPGRLRAGPSITERLWSYAARRFCRDQVHVFAPEIVARPARVRWTATGIDVTLPMSSVDVRIRRWGLDIDPGYLPWLGRTVHFHYHLEEIHGGRRNHRP